MEPIIIFENTRQAYDCLFYWQDILSLNDWIIDIYLQYNDTVRAPAWGKSKIYRAIHAAQIYLPMPKPGQINNFPQRYTQELIVVHELLHVRNPTVEMEIENTASDFYEQESHASLELMAKGYIMAKYRLPFSYFENF